MMDSTQNPLLTKSKLPYGAFPFDLLRKEHFRPALEKTIEMAKKNVSTIRDSSSSPTFENTIVALETAAEDVHHVHLIFANLLGTNSDDELQAMAREFSPQLADFSSDILLDSDLFSRVKTIWNSRTTLKLNTEDLRLTEKTYEDFVRNGALLNAQQKDRLRALDQELSKLAPEFSDNVLKATNDFKLWLDQETDLNGLPSSLKEAAAIAAQEAGHDGKWLFTLHAPSYIPFLTYSSRADLREKMWRAYNSRSFRDSHSNEELVLKIVQLRFERASILGFKSHAHFVLEERMAETPERVTAFLQRLLEKSKPAAVRDVEAVRALKVKLGSSQDLMPWDYTYYSEKLKMQLHDLDEEELRPYFRLENVVAGVFELSRRLYGLKFKEVNNVPVYHPDVKTFEVTDEESGRFIGLLYTDFFPRESKRGGGWMSLFRNQGLFGGQIERPQVTIVCNFTKPTETKPSLLTFDEVSTLFHEFGHALHGLLSDCRYVSIGGVNVFWDFVELPSQIMENWVLEKDALDLFASHFETGEKIPKVLTDKIRSAARFQAGYFSVRQLQFALLDMAWHSNTTAEPVLNTTLTDVDQFERTVTEPTRLLPRIEGANSSCSFSHIFAGGYSAGYYSYKWAEVLDADAFELFKEKGLFSREVARGFREQILSKGGSQHPMQLYKNFRGREPDPNALLRRDGLIDDGRGR